MHIVKNPIHVVRYVGVDAGEAADAASLGSEGHDPPLDVPHTVGSKLAGVHERTPGVSAARVLVLDPTGT